MNNVNIEKAIQNVLKNDIVRKVTKESVIHTLQKNLSSDNKILIIIGIFLLYNFYSFYKLFVKLFVVLVISYLIKYSNLVIKY